MIGKANIKLYLMLITGLTLALPVYSADMLFVTGDREHIASSQRYSDGSYAEPKCERHGSKGWLRGLWHWQEAQSKFDYLLGGCRNCSEISGKVVCTENTANSGDYLKQLVTYGKSNVAVSPDGRWAAVSGLSLDLPLFLLEQPKAQETLDGGSINPVVYPNHYRILLVDLDALEKGFTPDAVYPLLDTHRRHTRGPNTVDIDPSLAALWPHLAAKELGVNPRSTEGADHESFDWGENAELHMEFIQDFSERGYRLYFRVKQFKTYELRYTEFNNYETDRLAYAGAHTSFVIDIDEPDFPTLYRTVVPNQTYVATSTITSTEKNAPIASFTLSPLMEQGQYVIRGRFFPASIVPLWRRLFESDELVYEIWLESHEDAANWFDNPVGKRPHSMFANYYSTKHLFDPLMQWFDDRLYVRTSNTDGAIFTMDQVLAAAGNLQGDLDSSAIEVEPIRTIAAARGFDFHGLSMDMAWDHAFNVPYEPHNQVVLHGDYAIVTEHHTLYGLASTGFRADIDLGYLFNWREQEARYLIYPFYKPKGFRYHRHTWEITAAAERADSRRDTLRQLSRGQVRPEHMVELYEASPEDIRFADDGDYIYFLEARPTWDYGAVDHRLRQLTRERLPRTEDFSKMRWPALARISVNRSAENEIERLGHKGGQPGWYKGLLFDDYVPSTNVVPAQGVSSYSFVPARANDINEWLAKDD